MPDLHPAVRDVYEADPPLGTAELDIHMIARAARLVDASMKRYARCLAGDHGALTDPDQVLNQAEDYLKEALRRFRRLRRLLAAREETGFVDVHVGQVWQALDPRRADRRLTIVEVTPLVVKALSSPTDVRSRGNGITCTVRREDMGLDYRLIEHTPEHLRSRTERSGTETP